MLFIGFLRDKLANFWFLTDTWWKKGLLLMYLISLVSFSYSYLSWSTFIQSKVSIPPDLDAFLSNYLDDFFFFCIVFFTFLGVLLIFSRGTLPSLRAVKKRSLKAIFTWMLVLILLLGSWYFRHSIGENLFVYFYFFWDFWQVLIFFTFIQPAINPVDSHYDPQGLKKRGYFWLFLLSTILLAIGWVIQQFIGMASVGNFTLSLMLGGVETILFSGPIPLENVSLIICGGMILVLACFLVILKLRSFISSSTAISEKMGLLPVIFFLCSVVAVLNLAYFVFFDLTTDTSTAVTESWVDILITVGTILLGIWSILDYISADSDGPFLVLSGGKIPVYSRVLFIFAFSGAHFSFSKILENEGINRTFIVLNVNVESILVIESLSLMFLTPLAFAYFIWRYRVKTKKNRKRPSKRKK
ncbi:MAG: hypothetical protein ACFFD4_15705 [Candidatus Odinarchaeota archaeon]